MIAFKRSVSVNISFSNRDFEEECYSNCLNESTVGNAQKNGSGWCLFQKKVVYLHAINSNRT